MLKPNRHSVTDRGILRAVVLAYVGQHNARFPDRPIDYEEGHRRLSHFRRPETDDGAGFRDSDPRSAALTDPKGNLAEQYARQGVV